MRLDGASPLDVYFAFRLAFSDVPWVRIRVTDDEGARRPGYGRFAAPTGALGVRVFLSTDATLEDADELGVDGWYEPMLPGWSLPAGDGSDPSFVTLPLANWALEERVRFEAQHSRVRAWRVADRRFAHDVLGPDDSIVSLA